MASTGEDRGRVAQKRRTRKAIVAAAASLLAKGHTPSMTEIAEAADVSRRTVYMYFPTVEQLLIDAALLAMTRDTVDAALTAVDAEQDAERRVDALARAVSRDFESTEQHGRTLLRLTVDASRDHLPPDQPVRGYRRIEWIEHALAPLHGALTPPQFERLVSALAMVIGWEALIVARDIRALSLQDAEEVSAWAARILVRAALDESATTSARVSPRRGRRQARR
jgi:AcrR family transcriptional regulator